MAGLAVFRIVLGSAARMVARGELPAVTGGAGLLTTGGAMAIDLAALGGGSDGD
jgi:hypothetical protein